MVAGMRLSAAVRVRLNGFLLDATVIAPRGEITAVIGPNASGKTTLLEAIAGLIPLESGVVELGDEVLENVDTGQRIAPQDRRVGYVFQDSLLFPHMSALENIAYGIRAGGRSKRDAQSDARAVLREAGLEEIARLKADELSGGRRQLVSLLRARARGPELLLLDEPTSSIDAVSRPVVRRELTEMIKSFDGVTLLVSHDPVEAMSLASRIFVLEEGKVVQWGSPQELAARPSSRYVAEVVGLNLWRGAARDGTVLTGSGGRIVTAEQISGDVIAVAHPHAVALHTTKPTGTPRNVWSGRVESIEPIGSGRLRIRIFAEIPLVAEITLAARDELKLGAGVRVWATLKATEVNAYKV
jgi:molybdate transport system ATP-binding protein